MIFLTAEQPVGIFYMIHLIPESRGTPTSYLRFLFAHESLYASLPFRMNLPFTDHGIQILNMYINTEGPIHIEDSSES